MVRADPGGVTTVLGASHAGRSPWSGLTQTGSIWPRVVMPGGPLKGAFIASELIHLGARNYCPRSLRTPSVPLPLPNRAPDSSWASLLFPSLLSVSATGASPYCRALPSHLDLHAACMGKRSVVQNCILGLCPAPDSSASEICDRTLRFLRQIASRTHTHTHTHTHSRLGHSCLRRSGFLDRCSPPCNRRSSDPHV